MTPSLHQRLRALRSAQRHVQPDEAWVQATRKTLLMQAENSLPTVRMSVGGQVKHVLESLAPRRLAQLVRGPVMATISILVVALGGSVASVSAAEQALPGDFLYSLKLATEQARLALTPAKDEKLKLKIEFTSRRGEELKRVVAEDVPSKPERVQKTTEILKRDLNTVKRQLEEVKSTAEPKKVVEVAKLVDQTSNELVQSLQASKSVLSVESKDRVTEAQAAAADTGVKAIEVMVEKHKESVDAIPEAEVVEVMQSHSKTVADATGVPTPVTTSTTMLAEHATNTAPVPLDQAILEIKVATQQAFAVAASSTSLALPDASSSSTSTVSSSTSPYLVTATSSNSTTPIAPTSSSTDASAEAAPSTPTPP